MRRTQPSTKKAKISSTTHVQLLQWLHCKQQQQEVLFRSTSKLAQHKGPAHKMTLVQDTDYQILSAGEDGQVLMI